MNERENGMVTRLECWLEINKENTMNTFPLDVLTVGIKLKKVKWDLYKYEVST